MKKLVFLIVAILLVFVFSFSTFAIDISVDDEFYVYNKRNEKICEVLGVEENALNSYIEQNNVEFFAVDKDNKRQIKLLCYETDFSNSVVNISSMSNDSISSLVAEITGMDNVKGDIITQNEQKFIVTSVITADSGGEYILTCYTTVANRKNYVLNFYTLKGEDTDYTEEIFETYAKSKEFIGEEEESYSLERVLIFVGIVFFIAAFVMVSVTVFKDLKNKDSDYEIEETEDDTQEAEQQDTEENEEIE